MEFTTFVPDILAAVLAASLFAFLFFLVREKCFGIPDVTGKWYFEIRTDSSLYNPYIGMVLRFVAIIWRDGNRLSGTTEKIYENSRNGERSFIGKYRTRGTIDGYYEQRYFSKMDRVTFHLIEQGHGRQSTYYFDLEMSKTEDPTGEFSSMIADQIGTCRWQRKPF